MPKPEQPAVVAPPAPAAPETPPAPAAPKPWDPVTITNGARIRQCNRTDLPAFERAGYKKVEAPQS